ncbi:MAG: hypothetical protein AAGJ82_09225, partial [Bacteroidota bacterium]
LICQGEQLQLSAQVTGGDGAYTYYWSPTDGLSDATLASPLVSPTQTTTYVLLVTDGQGQDAQDEITVEVAPAPIPQLIGTDVLCSGAASGEITSLSNPDWVYQWDTGATSPTITGLSGGTYCLTVTTFQGCVGVSCLTIVEPTALTGGYVIDENTDCNGPSNASITINVNGGSPPYSYSLNNDPFQDENTFTNLPVGDYIMSVLDNNGCVVQFFDSVTTEGGLQATIEGGRELCSDDPVQLTGNIVGGTPPFSFLWSDGQISPFITIDPNDGDVYTLMVADANGCTAEATTTIQILGLPSMTVENVIGTSCGEANGAFTFNFGNDNVGGLLQFSLDGGNTYSSPVSVDVGTFTIQNLAAGDYDIWARWGSGACATAITVVNIPSSETFGLELNDDLSICPGETATLSATITGTPVGELSFLWPGGETAEPTTTVSPSETTTYQVTVTDNNCAQVAEVTVNVGLTLTADITDGSCDGTTLGSIDLTVSGGSGNYSYVWTGPDGYTNTTAAITDLAAGLYTVNVNDDNDECVSMATYEVTEVNDIDVEFVVSNVSCGGEADGLVFISSPLQPDWLFAWSNGSTQPGLQGVSAGEHCVTITDGLGCTQVECVFVLEPEPIEVTVDGLPTEPCETNYQLTAQVTGGIAPYAYEWRTSGILFSNSNIASGGPDFVEIELSVTDANGCSVLQIFTIDTQVNATISTSGILSCTTGEVVLDGSTSSSGPNITYQWIDPVGNIIGDHAIITVTESGTYEFIVSHTDTDGNPCSVTATTTVTDPATDLDLAILTQVLGCNSYRLAGQVPNDYSGVVLYTWTLPDGSISTEQTLIPTQSGLYSLETYVVGYDCYYYASTIIDLTADECATIRGRVLNDESEDCLVNADEAGLAGVIVTATGDLFLYSAITDADGAYEMSVPVGDYTLTTTLPSTSWQACQDSYPVSVAAGEIAEQDILLQRLISCPELQVDLMAGIIRRCFSGTYFLSVTNIGSETATDPQVLLDLDEFLSFTSATLAPTQVAGGQVSWSIPTLAPGQTFLITVTVAVSCEAQLGQVHCSEVIATPDPLCVEANGWDGGNLQLRGECSGDEVQFTVRNAGTAPSSPVQYIVIEDAVAMMQPVVLDPLNPGAEETFDVPANGSTYTFQIDQVENHPYTDQLSVSLEGCGLNEMNLFSTGFVTQFPQTTALITSDIHCEENIGAYDPNDKTANPVGYGAEHYVTPETELQYRIRFQNTGTDTAFTVIIRDTLSEHFDLRSLELGAATHDYELTISEERILTFTFNNILLPDSTTNLEASQGAVFFRIAPLVETPLETVIENSAAIYFDFNEPVITNTAFHTLGRNFLPVVSAVMTPGSRTQFQVFPNPVRDQLTLQLHGEIPKQAITRLYNVNHQLLLEGRFSGQTHDLSLRALPAGLYVLQLLDERGCLLGSARVMKE